MQVEELRVIADSREQIVIAVSIAKGQHFDQLIGQCTQLGVNRICPVLFERTVKQADNPKVVGRWRNIAIAAAKQCRRLHLPRIDAPRPLGLVLETLKTDYPKARLLAGSLSQDCQPLIGQPTVTSDVIAFVGPEGGFTPDEQRLLESNGAGFVRLTDTVLRVETAAAAFAAILAAQRDS